MFSANTSQVSNDVKYIEDFFSAWLRTGTGSSQTVTTGIKENTGALVISKSRSAATDWAWYDTFRGATKDLVSNSTAAETTQSQGLTAFNTDGHTWGTLAKVNTSGATYVDFVLKPTPKFFDVVTYTGNGANGRNISHNLGSVPGCIIVKRTDTTSDWTVYHRSLGTVGDPYSYIMALNTTAAQVASGAWNDSAPTSTTFQVGNSAAVNANGGTYVAYLFAHNAGGFGLTGTDNVISCGSFTTNGSGAASVTLGYEPQFVMFKSSAGSTTNWTMLDSMRGWTNNSAGFDPDLSANLSAAESDAGSGNDLGYPTATGFTISNQSVGVTFIYIAIRRGPMKTPTSGTSVFSPNAVTSSSSNTIVDAGFPIDLSILKIRNAVDSPSWFDRLRGITASSNPALRSPSTAAEVSTTDLQNAGQTTVQVGPIGTYNDILWNFRRAPGFFDEVCYTGTGSATTQTHNLGVAPELIIIKKRSTTGTWPVYTQSVGATQYLTLNSTNSVSSGVNTVYWNDTSPTASVFSVGTSAEVNASGSTYVAYLFASCPGVSKVGSYAGTASTQTISCGFAARFVLIKRTDSAGSWWVWDTARGMVAGTDPRLALNSTAAETNANWVYTNASGFQIVTTDATVNASGGSYIYLAIA